MINAAPEVPVNLALGSHEGCAGVVGRSPGWFLATPQRSELRRDHAAGAVVFRGRVVHNDCGRPNAFITLVLLQPGPRPACTRPTPR